MAKLLSIWKGILKKSRLYRVKKELDEWYATHALSLHQRGNVNAFRKDYEKKVDLLTKEFELAHHTITLQFAEHELAYLKASHAEKEAKQNDRPNPPADPENAKKES